MKKAEFFEARKLRQEGLSLVEICDVVKVSKSTVSVWVKDITLTQSAEERLRKKVTAGQIKSAENKRARTKADLQDRYDNTLSNLPQLILDNFHSKLLCGLLYRCEGGKGENRIQFTNSDPSLIEAFLRLLRSGYVLDESKFRVCVHLHDYHKVDKQVSFWSKVTKIPKSQFIKPFIKANQGCNIHREYQGCAQVRYHDVKVARDLVATGQATVDYINRSLV